MSENIWHSIWKLCEWNTCLIKKKIKKKETDRKVFCCWLKNKQPTTQLSKTQRNKTKTQNETTHRHTQWFCSFGNRKMRLVKRVPLAPYLFSDSGNYYLLTKKKDRKQVPTSARCDLSLCMLSHPLEANGLEISWSEDEVLDKYQIHTMNLSQFVLTTFYSLWCHDF